MKRLKSGGGWPAIWYSLRTSRQVGGFWKMFRALRSKNACKTCALGMGGQRGGMVNESGHWPEVCKKSIQAMAADMQGAIPDEFWSTYSIEQLKRFSPRQLESCGRLNYPVICQRGEQYFRPISWDEALPRIAHRLKSLAPAESFWYFSGRSSNEAGFLLQLVARLYGTNNVNNCSYYCHQASGVGLTTVTGSSTATIVLEDLDLADTVFLIGGNPASNHPRMMTSLMKLRRRGGQVIVINPVVETGLVNFRVPSNVRSLLFGSEIASLYVQPHIGGDLALLTGIAKAVFERGQHDADFLRDHCQGGEAWLRQLALLAWPEIERKSGVDRQLIERVAEVYGASRNAIFCWTMGITHHAHGVENVQAIANLALLRGLIGRPGCGLLPIRGHSNVQGIGSMGVTPQLKEAIRERLREDYGIALPTELGLDTLECMEQAHAGRIKFGLCLGGNLYGSNPDAKFAAEALARLEMLVYLNTTLNTGHAHGLAGETLILPVQARDEESQATTQESMFNFVRLSEGGRRRLPGPQAEVAVIADLAGRVLGRSTPFDWAALRDHANIRQVIGRVVPGFEEIAAIDRTRHEFHIGGRTFHQPKFATASGRANIHTHDLPELSDGIGMLRLMTVRSEGQFNTVVYEDTDLYRGQDRRDVILIHPDDLARLGLRPEQRVTVSSPTGRMEGIVARAFAEIKPGNALMYYPESNVLVPRVVDPRSKTPAFKNVLVAVVSEPDQPPPPRAADRQPVVTGRQTAAHPPE
jgi:molybdopterin-dependent oxidoreductase alpha subunit